MLDSNWTRWISASIANHFYSYRNGKPMYMQGEHFDDINQDHFELRIDGPYVIELHKNYYRLITEVNVLVATYMNNNFYDHRQNLGQMMSAFTKCIQCYKYPDADGNNGDSSLLGNLTLITHPKGTRKNWIQVSDFGQIDNNVKLQQGTVEGHYIMEFTNA